MRFSVNWIDGAPNASSEERATVGELRIIVGEENACAHWDDLDGAPYDFVTLPVIYLAEGIATDWWSIFGGRDRPHSIRPYRTGFILPCLSLSCDGSTFELSGQQMQCDNPGLRFWSPGIESLPRNEAESELSQFVETVIERLEEFGIGETEVALQWARVSHSRRDPEESAFCEAAGALGVNPYSVGNADASFILAAGKVLSGPPLNDFLAGLGRFHERQRDSTLEAVTSVASEEGTSSRLPDLADARMAVGAELRERHAGEGAWGPGYRVARALRGVLGIGDHETLRGVPALAGKLGNDLFDLSPRLTGLSGVDAVVSRRDDIYVHLRQTHNRVNVAENFSFARAIGDAVCFPDGGHSVVNRLHGAERQAISRAFAAEFLAPAEAVKEMSEDGFDSDEIAPAFAVSSQVIVHQIQNIQRIRRACAQHPSADESNSGSPPLRSADLE